jgi:hypothetical protein
MTKWAGSTSSHMTGAPLGRRLVADSHADQQPRRGRTDRFQNERPTPGHMIVTPGPGRVDRLACCGDLPEHQGLGWVGDRHGHRRARVEGHGAAGDQRWDVRVDPVEVAADASLEQVVAVTASPVLIAHLGEPGPDPLGRGVDGDGLGGVELGGGDEVIAG